MKDSKFTHVKVILFFTVLVSTSFPSCKKNTPPGEVIISNKKDTIPEVIIKETYSELLSDSASRAKFLYNSSENPNNVKRGYQGCAAIGYNNGILYAAWIAGKDGEEPNNYIPIAISSDMGETWIQNSLIIAPLNDNMRHFDPSFWNDKYGDLHLSWTMSNIMWDGGVGGVWSVKIKSNNNKVTITKPTRLFPGVMNVKPVHTSADSSTILFPVSGWSIGDTLFNGIHYTVTPPELNGAFLYKANYNTSTKGISSPQKIGRLPTSLPRVFDEHMIVETGKDTLVCMLRTATNGKGIGTMMSMNGGVSWGPETYFTELGPAASSRTYFGKLRSGNLIMVLNNSSNRENLVAYLSKNKGKSWPYKIIIDVRSGVSYPDIVQNDKDEICIIYDYIRNPSGHILFAKLTESDIVNGDQSRIKFSVISKLKN